MSHRANPWRVLGNPPPNGVQNTDAPGSQLKHDAPRRMQSAFSQQKNNQDARRAECDLQGSGFRFLCFIQVKNILSRLGEVHTPWRPLFLFLFPFFDFLNDCFF